MKIKRFFAKDMRAGLAEVKAALGNDAVIMQNRKVTGGVEIVAAVDDETAAAAAQSAPASANQPAKPQKPPFPKSLTQRLAPAKRELADDDVRLASRSSAQPVRSQRGLTQPVRPEPARQKTSAEKPASTLQELLARQSRQNSDSSVTPAAAQAASPEPAKSAVSMAQQQKMQNRIARSSSFFQQQQAQAEQQGVKWEPQPDQRVDAASSAQPDMSRRSASSSASSFSGGDATEIQLLREEMQTMRQMLEHQVSGLMWQEVERREPMRAFVIKQLRKLGLAEPVADQITSLIPENIAPDKAWAVALDTLCDQIHTSGDNLIERGGVVALLGPTGVGKTTTLAKLAARYAMRFGPDQVGLITTDTYRIGAHEQLATYGRIMGCPVRVANDSNDLRDALQMMSGRRLILIDTAGMGQRDTRLSKQLDSLVADSGLPISNYLVLPATAQRQVLEETIEHFQRVPLAGCIFTKLDECLSLGELFSVAIQHALSISYITDGQRVPEDIKAANGHYLVSQAIDMFTKQSRRRPKWMASVDPQMTGTV